NMAFVTLNDGLNNLDGVIFPDAYKKYEPLLNGDDVFIVKGKFDNRNNKKQLIINQIESIEAYESYIFNNAKQIVIRNLNDEPELEQYITQNKDNDHIPVEYFQEGQNNFKTIGYVARNNASIRELIQKFSPWDIRII
ncbi:DNA polymerase III subunit alpha, partial [Staphylococcus succinus]